MNNSHFKLNKEILSFYSSGLRDTTNSLDHQFQLLPLLGVNLQRHLHGAVRDGLSELAVLQLLAVDGDEGVLVLPASVEHLTIHPSLLPGCQRYQIIFQVM